MPQKMTRTLELEERRRIVAANILAGSNYRDIAGALNISLGTVANDVKIIMNRMRKEQVEEISEAALVDLRRIDFAINAIWDDIKAGKLLAIDRLIGLLRRRSEMLGYDEKVFNIALNATLDINDVREKRWADIAPQLAEALKNAGLTDCEDNPEVTTNEEEDGEDDATN